MNHFNTRIRNSYFVIFLISYTLISEAIFSQEKDSTKTSGTFSANITTDLVSRYIWRGQPFEQSFCFQPSLSFTLGGLTIGSWGSYSIARDQMDEHDIWITYALQTSIGAFSANIWDYHNPNAGGQFFNFKGKGEGSHVIELSVGFTGPELFPVNLLYSNNVHNDPSNSSYFELGYNCAIGENKLNFFCGAGKGDNPNWYNLDGNKWEIINVGLSLSKTIKITNDFSIPVGVTYLMNTFIEKSYLIFKITI